MGRRTTPASWCWPATPTVVTSPQNHTSQRSAALTHLGTARLMWCGSIEPLPHSPFSGVGSRWLQASHQLAATSFEKRETGNGKLLRQPRVLFVGIDHGNGSPGGGGDLVEHHAATGALGANMRKCLEQALRHVLARHLDQSQIGNVGVGSIKVASASSSKFPS